MNTTATTGTFTSNAGKVETTSSCVFWLTGKSGYQEFISERPTADPVKAYIKVKTENIGYGELTKTDESSGVKLSGAVYGIYSDSGCTNRVQTMTTDGNGYAKSAALVAGTYYVKEITAPKGYVLSGTVHTLTVKAGQTTGISATDKEQLGAITIYKEGEVLSSWNGSNFTYAIKQLEAEQNEQVKKKGRKAEPETVTADSAVKKQEEFEAMKKKTRNMLLGLVAVIVAAAAGIAAYKAMH